MTKSQVTAEVWIGDCIKVLKSMANSSIDCTITDPPYNLGIDYGSEVNDEKPNYAEWCKTWFSELRRVTKGAIAISCGIANIPLWGTFNPDWWLCWHKPAAMGRCPIGFNNWEPIPIWGKVVQQSCDVISAPLITKKHFKWHPCPKPIKWAVQQIAILSHEGETILDPFLGSGTIGVASLQLNRKFVGIEVNEIYATKAHKLLVDEASEVTFSRKAISASQIRLQNVKSKA